MNKLQLISGALGISVLLALAHVTVDYVELQPSTPGTAQSGNLSVDGTILGAKVGATDSGTTAQVISGSATATSGSTYAGLFKNASSDGRAVRGYATSTAGAGVGGDFQSDGPGGTAVRGIETATSGSSYGGYFKSSSSTGFGARGVATATSGSASGVYGESAGSSGRGVTGSATGTTGWNFGGYFTSPSWYGRGVYGGVTSLTGLNVGVEGECESEVGIGVLGEANDDTGQAYGVAGYSTSPNGRGVLGVATRSTTEASYGVYGASHSTIGFGTYGLAIADAGGAPGTSAGAYGNSDFRSGRGVWGIASSTAGTNYGVYGTTYSASGYGVFANGDIGSSGLKAFRIDHPREPLDKYLLHYCSEGPEPLNVYTGTVVTDRSGYAWIQLPDYFEDINRDPRYQLTVVDEGNSFAMAKVSKRIRNGRFQVRTSEPNISVCWEVKAVRNDAYVRTHGAPIELAKSESEKGTLQHPELFGKPAELRLGYEAGQPAVYRRPPGSR